jgi:hypothetical protein
MSKAVSHRAFSAFDGQGLLEQVDGDQTLFWAVLEAFRQEWPRRAADATGALSKRDADAARRALHALSGMLLQLEAEPRSAVAAVERLVRLGEIERAQNAWPGAARELERLDREIGELLERP